MSTGERWRLGHRPALDGLRGAAVLLVVASHALPERFVAAGPAGVTVFFVLSGFLITSLLLEEQARAGRINLRAFYRRRARRLFPALAVFLVVMLAVGATTVWQSLPVALYIGNWLPTFGYSVGGLGHTWSLAVEEQFYLVFPLVAILLLRRGRRLLLAVCVLAVAGSFVERFDLWASGSGIDRVYYGTDTNAGALLIGCAVAVLLASGPAPKLRPRAAAAAVALVGALGFAAEGGPARVLVPILAALLAVVVIVSVAGDDYSGFLTAGWLRLVGQRSYALYLWHVPLLTVVLPALPGSRWVTVPMMLAACWALTLLSWRYVEAPVMRHRKVSSSRSSESRTASPVAAGTAA